MTTTLFSVSFALVSTTLLVLVDRQLITNQQYYAYSAIWSTGMAVFCALNGWTVALYCGVVAAALSAWAWWNGGGGDDTKRRLRSWAARFRGVRRTAPSHA